MIAIILTLFVASVTMAESPAAAADPKAAVSAPAAAPAVVAAPAAPSVAAPVVAAPAEPKAVSTIENLVSKIPASLPIWVLSVLAFLVELIMRFWPTIQPRSLFILAGKIFGLVGEGFVKISKLLDSVVQNLKPPVA